MHHLATREEVGRKSNMGSTMMIIFTRGVKMALICRLIRTQITLLLARVSLTMERLIMIIGEGMTAITHPIKREVMRPYATNDRTSIGVVEAS